MYMMLKHVRLQKLIRKHLKPRRFLCLWPHCSGFTIISMSSLSKKCFFIRNYIDIIVMDGHAGEGSIILIYFYRVTCLRLFKCLMSNTVIGFNLEKHKLIIYWHRCQLWDPIFVIPLVK